MLLLKPDDYLTKNFQYKEVCVSARYPDYVLELLKTVGGFNEFAFILADDILQPARDHIDAPIHITRWFADPYLNEIIGGTYNSLHLKCLAADITTDKKTDLFQIYAFIKASLIDKVCELILYTDEHNNPIFIHVARKMWGRKIIIKKTIYKK